ncbi:MAG: hypothetical protein VXZ99_20270 [Pseudomonadota bacterium]|nr:hypothetical protein [Pseudomonadota bacterium]
MPENELQHGASPYLLQHKANLAHWMAWGDAAFVGEAHAQRQLSRALEDDDPLAAHLFATLASHDRDHI